MPTFTFTVAALRLVCYTAFVRTPRLRYVYYILLHIRLHYIYVTGLPGCRYPDITLPLPHVGYTPRVTTFAVHTRLRLRCRLRLRSRGYADTHTHVTVAVTVYPFGYILPHTPRLPLRYVAVWLPCRSVTHLRLHRYGYGWLRGCVTVGYHVHALLLHTTTCHVYVYRYTRFTRTVPTLCGLRLRGCVRFCVTLPPHGLPHTTAFTAHVPGLRSATHTFCLPRLRYGLFALRVLRLRSAVTLPFGYGYVYIHTVGWVVTYVPVYGYWFGDVDFVIAELRFICCCCYIVVTPRYITVPVRYGDLRYFTRCRLLLRFTLCTVVRYIALLIAICVTVTFTC